MIDLAYIKKKGSNSTPNVEKLPYKGSGAVAKKLPFRGGNVEITPLKKEAKKKASSAVKGALTGGVGATVTKTNRATGASTTNKKTLTPTTKASFSSDSGKMMKKATPRSTTTAYKEAQSEKFNQKKKY